MSQLAGECLQWGTLWSIKPFPALGRSFKSYTRSSTWASWHAKLESNGLTQGSFNKVISVFHGVEPQQFSSYIRIWIHVQGLRSASFWKSYDLYVGLTPAGLFKGFKIISSITWADDKNVHLQVEVLMYSISHEWTLASLPEHIMLVPWKVLECSL